MKFPWYVFLGSLTLLVSFFYASTAPQLEQHWKGAVHRPNAAEAQPPQRGYIGPHKRAINSTANVTTKQTHLDEAIILGSTQTPNMSDHEPLNQQFNANLQICSGKMAILNTLLNELYPEQMTEDGIVESDVKANFSSNLVAYETALYEFVHLAQLTSPFGPADCLEKYQQILEMQFRETENDLIDNTKDEWKRALFRKTVIDLRRAMNELFNNCQSRGSLLIQGSAAADSVPGRNTRASVGDFEVKDDREDMDDRQRSDGSVRNVQNAGNV